MSAIETLTSDVQRLQTAVDWWNNFGLIFTAIIAIGAVGYYWASKKTFNIGEQLRQAQVALASAQEEQLKRDLKEKDLMIIELQKKMAPRHLDHKVLLEMLNGKPKARVEILFKPDDEEAYLLALQINGRLGKDGAGWEVITPRAFTEADIIEGHEDRLSPNSPTVPLSTKCGTWRGMGLVVKQLPLYKDEKEYMDNLENNPTMILHNALLFAGVGCSIMVPDSRLPDGLIRIVIGSKW